MMNPVQVKRVASFKPFKLFHKSSAYQIPEEYKNKFSANELEIFKRTFAYYDKDGNGSIDKAELGQVLWEFEKNGNEANISSIFDEADVDKNHEIDFSEFLLIMYKSKSVGDKDLIEGGFADLANKVGKKVIRITPGDLCYMPPHISGYLTFLFNALGFIISLAWVFLSVYYYPKASYAHAIVKTLKWMKIYNVKETLILDLVIPVYFGFGFLCPLTCCTAGPLDYGQVQTYQMFGAIIIIYITCVTNFQLEISYLFSYALVLVTIVSFFTLKKAAKFFESGRDELDEYQPPPARRVSDTSDNRLESGIEQVEVGKLNISSKNTKSEIKSETKPSIKPSISPVKSKALLPSSSGDEIVQSVTDRVAMRRSLSKQNISMTENGGRRPSIDHSSSTRDLLHEEQQELARWQRQRRQSGSKQGTII